MARLIASISRFAHCARSPDVLAAKTISWFTSPLGQWSMNGNLWSSAKAFIAGVIA